MATVINWQRWRAYRAAIETCLRNGFTPPGVFGGKGSAVMEAERTLRQSGGIAVGAKTNSVLACWLRAQARRVRAGLPHETPDWSLHQGTPRILAFAGSSAVRRVLLTSAQNDCAVHRPFWDNLKAYASHLGAEIHVAPFTYQLSVVRDRARSDAGSDEVRRLARVRQWSWAPELGNHLVREPLDLGPVVFFADMNQLPTAKAPLTDLETHSRGKWAVFPHAKLALKTVAASDDPPIICTTGAVTVEDYTDTKAGIKAVFHHVIGATLVEIDAAGKPYIRQINATGDGCFQDLDCLVRDGRVTTGNRVEAITFGDIQSPYLDPAVALGTFGFDVTEWRRAEAQATPCLLDALRPRFGFFHDLCDNKPISHHELRQSLERYRTFVNGHAMIEPHMQDAARFMLATLRDTMKTVLIESNHDKWLDRWLDSADHRRDRPNALAFLRWDLARHSAVARGEADFSIWRHALRETNPGRFDDVAFVNEGGGYIICHEAGGIECGAHGHLGANGSKGTMSGLARVSGKANFGDKHSPAIVDGAYFAGTSSLLRLGYNKGPSSWRHGHIVTYANGKRTIITMQGGKWRA
ncbi:MAG: hypothetical protein ACKVON_08105 [Beijerinckiaceae bacterium]